MTGTNIVDQFFISNQPSDFCRPKNDNRPIQKSISSTPTFISCEKNPFSVEFTFSLIKSFLSNRINFPRENTKHSALRLRYIFCCAFEANRRRVVGSIPGHDVLTHWSGLSDIGLWLLINKLTTIIKHLSFELTIKVGLSV